MQNLTNTSQLCAETSHLGQTLEALAATIEARREATAESYTYRLLTEKLDTLLKKVSEEALETCLAAKETSLASVSEQEQSKNHLRYEAADLVYHLMVLCVRFGISNDELAAELNARMTPEERPEGAPVMQQNNINRGK